jgi:hypothetical protein
VFRVFQTYSCSNNRCSSYRNDRLVNDCQFGCNNGNCNVPQCTQDLQCGSITTQRFCSGGNVMTRTLTPKCLSNSCTSQTNEVLSQVCNYGCSNGECIIAQIRCSSNSDCNDGNSRTVDECINAGTPQSYCRNTQVACMNDGECGISGFVDGNFCSYGDVFRQYVSYSCLNAGTLNSNCQIAAENRLINDCQFGCNNGNCNVPQCTQDSQCGSVSSVRMCVGLNVIDRVTTPKCTSNNCNSVVNDNIVQRCDYQCSGGACVSRPECLTASDCGSDGFIGDNFCSSGDVYRIFKTFSCLSNKCSSSQSNRLISDCLNGCSNGQCISQLPQCSDGIDNDGDRLVDYPADLGCTSTTDNDEYNAPPQCTQDRDCGTVSTVRMCVGLNVIDRVTTPKCLSNSCSSLVNDNIVQRCDYQCSGGACVSRPTLPQCSDGIDNDGDRLIDYPADPGCTSTTDNDEYNAPIVCNRDSDCGITGFIDGNFCSAGDVFRVFQTAVCNNPGTINSDCMISRENRLVQDCLNGCSGGSCTSQLPQCSDGIDNDGDRLVDYPADPGCTSTTDNDEYNAPILPQCSDGIDNDGDRLVDYPADRGCTGMTDNSE